MATQVLASVADESGQAVLEIDYDEASDPENWDLIRGRVINNMTRPCYLLIRRGNGQNWFEVTVEPGQTVAQDAGGPVKTMDDVPHMILVTR